MKARKYFPHSVKHGYRLAFIDDGALMTCPSLGQTHMTVEACAAECEERNKQQIADAQRELAVATSKWDEVRAVFDLPR